MAKKKRSHLRTREMTSLLFVALLALAFFPVSFAGGDGQSTDENQVVVGVQARTVDADEGRDARFDRNEDNPSGVVLDYFQWSSLGDSGWMQIKAWDASQLDERFSLRAGKGGLRISADYQSLPYRVSNGSRSILGSAGLDMYGPTFRIADWVQQAMQDPDGNGIDFYTSAAETASDNALVQAMTNDLFTGARTLALQSRRRKGSFGLTYSPTSNWNLGVSVKQEKRTGSQALGSGTYARITDVNGDGQTDSDYFFSIRGVEFAAPVNYRTTNFRANVGYHTDTWFLNAETTLSNFDNSYLGVTYDNPFWFDGINATSGSRRGLWEEGRASLEPSNEAFNLTFSGGFNFSRRTRLTAAVSFGEHTQNEKFLPITTNPGVIGTADINRDGVIDSQDDPTGMVSGISGMPSTIDGVKVIGSSLDASSDILAYNVALTSRPTKNLTLTARVRSYDYEGTEGIQVIPARTEYIESRVKLDFKGDLILHVPNNFSRDTIDLNATYRFARRFKVKAFAKRKSHDYQLYQDPDGNATRDSGTRAVAGTDDDIFGVTAMFGNGKVNGRLTLDTASRTHSGEYVPGFSGENILVRQYDIANRDRTGFDAQFDFMPTEKTSLGLGYRNNEDDYDDSQFGLQSGTTRIWSFSVNHAAASGLNLFAYADISTWDADMHLATKCKNCTDPTDSTGSLPYYWRVPNFDWFSNYNDETTSIGGGVNWTQGKTTVVFDLNYVEGIIEQTTRNPGTPLELDPSNPLFGTTANVAVGHDFPNQENSLVRMELQVIRKITKNMSAGFLWLYEDFTLEDFQWDNMEPYGANYLEVDDATRFLFLDSRYSDYNASIVQLFVKVVF